MPIRWLLLLSGGTGLVLAERFLRQHHLSALMLLFLLASLAGARTGFHVNTGARSGTEEVKQGLRNPHFRPIIIIDNRNSVTRSPPEHFMAVRPSWASEPVWGMAQAIMLNRRKALPSEWVAAFRSAGAAHLIAVSGLHIGILLGILLALLKVVQMRRSAAAITAIISSWIYIVMIGAPPSAVRAGLMASIGLGMWGAGRLPEPGRIVPTAVFVALVARPSLIASVGFQLSVAAVIGISLGLRGFKARTLETARGRLAVLLRITLGAQAGVLPVQILTFGNLLPLAPLVNVVAVPLMGIWLPSAVGAVFLGFLYGPAAAVAGAYCEGAGRLLLQWIYVWAGVPGVVVPAPAIAAALAAVGLVCWAVGGRGRLSALACLAAVVWIPAIEDGNPRISFLDVGQGDAIVIETGNYGRVVVLDSGPAFGDWSAARYVVAPYLHSRGIRRIDLMVVSHPDIDHMGGMEDLAAEFPVGFFVRGEWRTTDTASARRLQARLDAAGVETITPEAGDRIVLGDGSWIDVLHGLPSSKDMGSDAILSSNNRSLVMRLNLEGLTVLLCGDMERSGEGGLFRFRRFLPSTILKVPHHGGKDGLSDRLLDAVQPSLALISVGARNRYGHPSQVLLDRLRSAGIDVWRTDCSGALFLQADY